MKTLFLLGILGALVVIAFKKPDQTAWDAARELTDKAENVFSGLEKTTVKTHAEKSIQKALDKAKETLQNPDTILSSRQDKEPLFETKKPVQEKVVPQKYVDTPYAPPSSKPGSVEAEAEKTKTSEWPEIPSIPVLPHPINTPKRPLPVEDSPLATPETDYADVKVYYENASRLLDEIK